MPNNNVRKRRQRTITAEKLQETWVDRELANCDFKDERLGKRFRSLLERASATDGPILVIHDTTEFTYKREDVEVIGKTRINIAGAYRDGMPRYLTACGILMHSSLAVTADGLPLGLTAIKLWSRKKFKGSKARIR